MKRPDPSVSLKCPECFGPTFFDVGQAQSFDEPAIAPSIYCPECGWSDDVDTLIDIYEDDELLIDELLSLFDW